MPRTSELDCIVVGYHDVDFRLYAREQRKMAGYSGSYRDVKHNSVRLNGERLTYTELMNHVIKKATGQDPRLNVFEVPSMGVTYLTSYLRRRNFNAEMIGFFNYDMDKFADLLALSPTAVAITTTFYVDPAPLVDIMSFVREHNPETKIVVGGPLIYNICGQCDKAGKPDLKVQDHVLRSIGADIYVHDSQGEQTLCQLLEALNRSAYRDLDQVPNLIYTNDNQSFVRTRRQIENNDLNDDAVDWSLFRGDESFYSFPVFLRAARSCPFSCTFCNFPQVGGPHVISELDSLEKQFRYLHENGVKRISFVDDTFNVPLPRFKNLLRMMIRNQFDFNWMSFFRCSNADDVAFDLMQESGCTDVFLGIESADQQLLNNMNKFATVEKYRDSIAKLNERGIVSYASLMTGFPGESRDSVMRTIDFIEETSPALYNIQLYYHDVRAPVHRQAEEFGIQGAGYCWRHKTMDWQEAADWVDYGFTQIKSSIPITVYGFSCWVLPYLRSRGYSADQLKRFFGPARDLFVKSFDDADVDVSREIAEMVSVFRPDSAAAADRPYRLPGEPAMESADHPLLEQQPH